MRQQVLLLAAAAWAVVACLPGAPADGQEKNAGTQPASQPKQVVAPEATLGQAVNAWIDNLLATGVRILELPLFLLLAALGVVGAALAFIMWLLCRKQRRPWLFRGILALVAGGVVFAVAFAADRKLVRLHDEVVELRSGRTADVVRLLEAISKRDTKRTSFLFDAKEAADALKVLFGEVKLLPLIYDEATDLVQVRMTGPLARGYLVVVDLQHPAVEIKLGATIRKKRLTSEFARESNCTVAINGEAGVSPGSDSGLGQWQGNLVWRGQVILREDPKHPHPVLSFDRRNHATYFPAGAAQRAVEAGEYNVIWGRTDALLDGEVTTTNARHPQKEPRSAMAINKDGTRLFLLVVDGRQPNYSMGLTPAETAKLLKAFGAHNGMLCDEGGSSCIYLQKFGGISNTPSDGQGKERPTYTHFGLSLRAGEQP